MSDATRASNVDMISKTIARTARKMYEHKNGGTPKFLFMNWQMDDVVDEAFQRFGLLAYEHTPASYSFVFPVGNRLMKVSFNRVLYNKLYTAIQEMLPPVLVPLVLMYV